MPRQPLSVPDIPSLGEVNELHLCHRSDIRIHIDDYNHFKGLY